jgi:hypothetical protein
VRSCIANIVFSPADTSHTNTRAGGVSPPWNALSACELEAPKFVALELQTGFTNPRRAYARRSRLRQPPNTTAANHSAPTQERGGVSPPWNVPSAARSAEIRRIGIANGVYKPTAGLRPPLSVVLTISRRNYAILLAVAECEPRRAPPAALGCVDDSRRTTTPSCLAQRASCEPRRAYARRSWYCAFVHRKRRYFTGERSCCNQERGASAPRGRPSSETQRTGGTQALLAIASAHPTGKKRTLNANGCIEGRSGRNHLKSSLSIHPAKPIGVSSRRTFRDNRDSEGRPYICRNR